MNAIEKALYDKLVADTALVAELAHPTAVYNPIAPPDQSRPYVVFQHSGGGHLNLTPSPTQSHVYMVRGVADAPKAAGIIDQRIVDCLHEAILTVEGWTNYQTIVESELQSVETPETGMSIYHRGHYVRVGIDQ